MRIPPIVTNTCIIDICRLDEQRSETRTTTVRVEQQQHQHHFESASSSAADDGGVEDIKKRLERLRQQAF